MAYRVGVLGATGAVGSTILEILAERNFPVSEVVPLASARSAGKKLPFGDGEVEVVEISEESIQGLDIVLSSAGGSVSAEWAPKIIAAGAVVVDNTSYWRMDERVPLVVSEVNPDAVAGHQGLISNPNCTTMVMLTALAPVHRKWGIERLIVSSYQAVSGTGQKAINELLEQTKAALAGDEVPEPQVYPHRIAFNVLPQVETFKDGDDYTTEERKLMAETRKILGETEGSLAISATCARVPVITGHSESINIQTREPVEPQAVRDLLADAPGVIVIDDPGNGLYPLALDAAGNDEVLVGRVRRDPSHPNCLNLWVVGDNLRKGAALNTVQVAELLVERNLVAVPENTTLAA